MSKFVRLSILVVLFIALAAAPASADAWQLPVDGDVTDAFRPPATPYGAGNRGWEFGTNQGDGVRAANDGTVTFAGQVGGVLNVVVKHDNGVLTTYSRLESVKVVVGQIVSGGQQIATSGTNTYFGVRENGQYVDPATLFAGRPYLVPTDLHASADAPPETPTSNNLSKVSLSGTQARLLVAEQATAAKVTAGMAQLHL